VDQTDRARGRGVDEPVELLNGLSTFSGLRRNKEERIPSVPFFILETRFLARAIFREWSWKWSKGR